MELVSIVIVNWNKKDYLVRCLDSVKKQIYKNADKNPELLDTKFPDDPEGRIKLEHLDLTFEESLDGAYLDVTVDSKIKDVSPAIIISKNHGRHTEFLWEEYTEESKAKVKKKLSIKAAAEEAGIDLKDVSRYRDSFRL